MDISEKYKYNSIVVAKYIIAIANNKHLSINMTKVQKLLYIAYGIFLAVKGYRLTNEHPEAWPYGPVFPSTRYKLLKTDLYSISTSDSDICSIKEDSEIESLIDLVFRSFGSWSAAQLTEWSHSEGTPWQKTVSSDDFSWGHQIPDEYIKSYFSSIIKLSNESEK